MTFTTRPFLVAFFAGLCAMRALDIYDVHAWDVGTLQIDPWRTRTNGVSRALSRLRAQLGALWRGLLGTSGVWGPPVAAALVLWLAPHGGGALLVGAIAVGTPTEMRDRREKLIRDAGDLRGANNVFANDETRASFDAMLTDIAAYGVALEDADRGETLARLQRTTVPESQRQTSRTSDAAALTELRNRGIAMYLAGVPMLDMPTDERRAIQGSYQPFGQDEQARIREALSEQRDMSTFSAPAGGLLVAPDTSLYGQIIQAMKFFGGMEAVGAEVINSATAGPLPIAMGDDTANVGAIIPEAKASGHAGGTSPTLTSLTLNGFLYSSKVIKISWQAIRDSAANLESYVGGLLGERLARVQNTHFTTGTGGAQPQGLATIATVGRQSAVGNTTSVAFDDVFRLIHSVDIAYRTALCKWMFADSVALTLRLAKDGAGRYLWPEFGSVQVGQPLVLAGYPVVVNNDMAAMAASAKYASFGEHRYYKIRRIGGITLVRLNELYAESGQLGLLAFQSADGGFADAGQHPVKLLQNSAT